jgi:hypothetical protein
MHRHRGAWLRKDTWGERKDQSAEGEMPSARKPGSDDKGTQGGRSLRAFIVLVLLLLTACGPAPPLRSEYLSNVEGKATQDEIVQRFGPPHRTKALENGGSAWTYRFERIYYTWGGAARRCTQYTLTFNADKVLTDWDDEEC